MPTETAAQKAAAARGLSQHPFRPAWWARSGFTQTVTAAYGRRTRASNFEMERWTLPDGDFVRMHFAIAAAPAAAPAPLVLLLHGLEGSLGSGYVAAMLHAVRKAGWNLAVLEFRSCGGELNRARRTYHSGETSDLEFVITQLRARSPHRAIYLVGYSLGANVVLKWLGEHGAKVPEQLVAAAAVSAPFDLGTAARQCDARYGGLFARHFLKTLVPKALAKAKQFPGVLDVDAVRRCRSFEAFDNLVTAPLHGFRDAEHYWQSSNCAQFLPAVRVPTLLVGAADDPLVPGTVLPHAAVAQSPFLVPQFFAHGGHCAFVTGGVPGWPSRWAEVQVQRFFAMHEAWRSQVATSSPCPSRVVMSRLA